MSLTRTLLGIFSGLSLFLVLLEWRFYADVKSQLGELNVSEEVEELPPITQQEEIKPPPPPPQPQTNIEVVENTQEEKEIASTEATEQTEVQPVAPPPPPPEEKKVEEPQVYVIVEEMPEFPGGDAALLQYIQSNIRYPTYAREAGIQGTVFVSFVVDENGNVRDVQVLKGIGGGCDEEAVRVIKSLPKFKPGKQRGKPVRVKMQVPIRFVLK